MYLISIYFDETTENRFYNLIKQIAKHTGNETMMEGSIPPHLTIAGFYTESEETAYKIFEQTAASFKEGTIRWVSVGSFPGVIFLTPVLNEYLHGLSAACHREVLKYETVSSDKRYVPFSWLPHTTLAKRLSAEEQRKAFGVLQEQFGAFGGKAVKIGLAKTSPYRNLAIRRV